MEERLQKLMARCGFGSRRACEEMITTGRVTVNGDAAELGMKADPYKDVIRIDGEKLNYTEPEKVYIMLNKPRFVLSDRDYSDPRRTVFSLVDNSDGLFVVGRLDCESEGLMLLTNDGDLANKLSHPRYGKEKEYQVLVAKRPDEKQLKAWRHGVILEDGTQTGAANVAVSSVNGKGCWLRVVMTEGHKREIREICKTIGIPVVRLVRVRLGSLELGDLKSGEYKPLNENQVKALRALVSGKPRAEIQAAAFARLGEQESRAEEREKSKFHGKTSRGGAAYGKSSWEKHEDHGEKPSYGKRESYGSKAAYGKREDGENKSSYGKRESFGSKAAYGKREDGENKSSYGKRESYGSKPAYGKREDGENKSSYGKRESYGSKPAYGKREDGENKSSYGKRESYGSKPAYGKREDGENKSSYGKRDSYGSKPAYGKRNENGSDGKSEHSSYRKSERPHSNYSGHSGSASNGTKKYPKKKVM